MSKSILARQPDGTVQLTITIPADEVKKAYDQALGEVTQNTQVSGFRKGKAPVKLVEEQTDKTKIYEQVLQKMVPQAYLAALEEHQVKPVLPPKVELLKAKEGEDWEIRASTCERPAVTLGDYKEEIRKTLAPAKLWTPGTQKAHPPVGEAGNKTDDTETEEEKSQKVIEVLSQTTKVDLPAIMVEDEVNHALANLLNQTNKLGLTIDQYLASIGKSAEQLRAEYRQKVENDLKLQLILDEIAKKENLEVKDEEIDSLINAAGDEKIKQDLNSPAQRAYLRGILLRRKGLDFLTKL